MNMLIVLIVITNCLLPKWRTKAGCRTSQLKGRAIQTWFGMEGRFSTHHTSWAFILWSLEIGFYFIFYRTGHKNVLHRHGMIPYGALFHYFLWFEMCTDHINISSLRGLLLRELLNWLVLLLVNHTGYKNIFFFLLSYMVRSIFGIVFFNLKKFLRNALAEF